MIRKEGPKCSNRALFFFRNLFMKLKHHNKFAYNPFYLTLLKAVHGIDLTLDFGKSKYVFKCAVLVHTITQIFFFAKTLDNTKNKSSNPQLINISREFL